LKFVLTCKNILNYLKLLLQVYNLNTMQAISKRFIETNNIADMMEAGLLQENWSWVDQRLQELFNEYALNDINAEDFVAAGLLPMEIDEEQDTNLLIRKHLRSLASVVQMDIQLANELGQKRGRDEPDQDDGPLRKISRIQPTGNPIFIPNPNPFRFVNIVSDDESESDRDSLAEAFENLTIHSEFSGIFPMSIEEEDFFVDEEDNYDSDDWEHMSIESNN